MSDTITAITTPVAAAKWWAADYAARYYACSNSSVLIRGYPSVMWVDVDVFPSAPNWLPVASAMIALTESEWTARVTVNQIIKDGAVQSYVASTTTDATTTATTINSSKTASN